MVGDNDAHDTLWHTPLHTRPDPFRDSTDRLWHAPLHMPHNDSNSMDNHFSCHTLRHHSTIAQRVAYYHACLGSPTMSTWCTAIDSGHLTTFPALTSTQVRKPFPHTIATYMGHLDQTRQGQYSTKIHSRPVESPTIPHRLGTIYADPTGKFIVPSTQGNNYILVVFDTDSNYIFAEPMPSRTTNQILLAYEKIHTLLTTWGIIPSLHIMDNEMSYLLKDYITRHHSKYQLVPPNQHRANAAERAIRTFKNHFISILCSCDPSFPLNLWDRLIDQAVITLNLMRTSTINPKLSAYAQIHGSFDFNVAPLGPPGTKVVIHEKPQQRETWAPHGVDGWYLGPAIDHYRNFVVYVPSTRSIRISDTLAWFPTKVLMPTATSSEIAMAAAYDLTQALLHPSPASALSPLSDSQRQALIQLATIFGHMGLPVEQPQPLPPIASPQPRVEIDSHEVPQAQPRVETQQQPRVNATEPRVAPVGVETDEPRVCWSTPIASGITEPLSSQLTTNVPID